MLYEYWRNHRNCQYVLISKGLLSLLVCHHVNVSFCQLNVSLKSHRVHSASLLPTFFIYYILRIWLFLRVFFVKRFIYDGIYTCKFNIFSIFFLNLQTMIFISWVVKLISFIFMTLLYEIMMFLVCLCIFLSILLSLCVCLHL